jgi:glycosyltransferase involved in cell wall biosynthesis
MKNGLRRTGIEKPATSDLTLKIQKGLSKMHKEKDLSKKRPSIHIAMPCYDTVKIQTMISMIKLVKELTMAGLKFEINTMKSPYVAYARNILTARFLQRDEDYLLFIDADLEFEPECILKMLILDKDIICTPYRAKTNNPDAIQYTVSIEDPQNVKILQGGLVEIQNGPAGMMLIKRKVFEKLIKDYPEKEIKVHPNENTFPKDMRIWNWWDCNFKDGVWKGEDIFFCDLVREAGFKVYANITSSLVHHGSFGYKGTYGDKFKMKKKNGQST